MTFLESDYEFPSSPGKAYILSSPEIKRLASLQEIHTSPERHSVSLLLKCICFEAKGATYLREDSTGLIATQIPTRIRSFPSPWLMLVVVFNILLIVSCLLELSRAFTMDYLENGNDETYEICTCCIRGECMFECSKICSTLTSKTSVPDRDGQDLHT
jgi:hypothetical protein